MANNQANSGSDLLPVSYPVVATATTYFWESPHDTYLATNFSHPVVQPTYAGFAVTGPSQTIVAMQNQGQVQCKVTQSTIRISGAQAYVPVIYNCVYYQISVGATVTIPQIIFDIINQSSTFAAVIV